MSESHEYYMELAIKMAEEAEKKGTLPVGAIVVRGGQIISQAHSRVSLDNDPTAHAEILALRQAASVLGKPYLAGCTMYDSFEPCPMCCGAIVSSGIDAVVVGGRFQGADRSYGSYSVEDLLAITGAKSRVHLIDGVLRERCNAVLTIEKRRALGGIRES